MLPILAFSLIQATLLLRKMFFNFNTSFDTNKELILLGKYL